MTDLRESLAVAAPADAVYDLLTDDVDPSACTVVEEWTDRRPLWYRDGWSSPRRPTETGAAISSLRAERHRR
jgi:hypothetical protein